MSEGVVPLNSVITLSTLNMLPLTADGRVTAARLPPFRSAAHRRRSCR